MASHKEYSVAIRIYHWLNALIISGIILTVFSRSKWLEKFKIRDLILSFADKNDIPISKDMASQMAKMVRNQIWDFHYTLGIILAILLIMRIILLFFPDGRRIFKEGFTVFGKVKAKRASIKFLYIIVYLTLIVAAITGLLILYYKQVGLTHDFKESLQSIHSGLVIIIIYFVPLHLIGVIMGELGNDKGIVSKMINGGEKNIE